MLSQDIQKILIEKDGYLTSDSEIEVATSLLSVVVTIKIHLLI